MQGFYNGRVIDETILQDADNAVDSADSRGAVTLRDIFNLFAEHGSAKKIIRFRPDIRPETITLARAFLIAKYPEAYTTICRSKPLKDYRLLIDENIPARVIPAIRNGFGYATHTNFTGLAGKKDPEVWAWAVKNNIDAIITRDRVCPTGQRAQKGKKAVVREDAEFQDLTEISVHSSLRTLKHAIEEGGSVAFDELPLIVHVYCGDQSVGNAVARLFNRHQEEIHRHIEMRTSPFIAVRENSVALGPTYAELKASVVKTPEELREEKSRLDQWVEKWMHAILSPKPKESVTPELREKIRAMVEDSARQCAMSPSPRATYTSNGRTAVLRAGAHLP